MRDLVTMANTGRDVDKPTAADLAAGPVKAIDVKRALMARYSPPSQRIFFEVADDTGFNQKRWIDAVAVPIWKGKGQGEIIGIEIKVSRGDWLRELKQPAKAEALMKYCTRWFLAAPAGVVKIDELPATWGLLSYQGGAVRERVPAKLLEPEPMSRGFMAGLLRHANAVDGEIIDQIRAQARVDAEVGAEQRLRDGIARKQADVSGRNEEALKIMATLEKMTGESFNQWSRAIDVEAFAAAYSFCKKANAAGGMDRAYSGLPSAIREVRMALSTMQAIFDHPALAELRAASDAAKPPKGNLFDR